MVQTERVRLPPLPPCRGRITAVRLFGKEEVRVQFPPPAPSFAALQIAGRSRSTAGPPPCKRKMSVRLRRPAPGIRRPRPRPGHLSHKEEISVGIRGSAPKGGFGHAAGPLRSKRGRRQKPSCAFDSRTLLQNPGAWRKRNAVVCKTTRCRCNSCRALHAGVVQKQNTSFVMRKRRSVTGHRLHSGIVSGVARLPVKQKGPVRIQLPLPKIRPRGVGDARPASIRQGSVRSRAGVPLPSANGRPPRSHRGNEGFNSPRERQGDVV